jgi:transposase
LKALSFDRVRSGSEPLLSPRRYRLDQPNALAFDVRAALFALLGKDITQIDGLGPYLSLKLIAECGDDLACWPSAKYFTSWLGLAPSNTISGGKILSSRTRRSGGRAAASAVTAGRTDTALAPSTDGSLRASTRPRWSPPRRERSQPYAVRHGME